MLGRKSANSEVSRTVFITILTIFKTKYRKWKKESVGWVSLKTKSILKLENNYIHFKFYLLILQLNHQRFELLPGQT
jgi:hypothetical protein